MTNCENLQSDLPLYMDDVLSGAERASIEAHLPTCPLCRQRLSEYKDLRNELRSVPRPFVPADLLQNVRRAVTNELERPVLRTGTEAEPTFREKAAHWLLPYSVGTVTASVFAFFLLGMLVSTKDLTGEILARSQAPERTTIRLAEPTDRPERAESSNPPEFIAPEGYPPRVNPAGALVALTKSIVRGKMSDEEVVIVADVFGNGAARISEVVEPPSDKAAMSELQKAFRTDPEDAPFLPAGDVRGTRPIPVVIKLQQVDVVDRDR